MSNSHRCDSTITAFAIDYHRYLVDVRGLAPNSCKLHLRVVGGLLHMCFPSDAIRWRDLRFSQIAEFLTKEFRRLPNHWTQRAWLMATRRLVRYLELEGHIPSGWEDALPKRVNWKRVNLPRGLSPEQIQGLWNSCQNATHRHLRDRALLLVYTKLGLRTEEVAGLTLKDIDWKDGRLLVRSSKTRRERILPLPRDVGEGLIEHLRIRPQNSPQVFAPRRPPFTGQRCLDHVRNCMAYLFRRAGIPHARLHTLRHTAATGMVNRGASFKEIADVLGHKSLSTTLIYAKLDMKALAKVSLPWPGGAR
jgi:integrase